MSQTGQIGLFKIVSESAVAAGVRRIEAVTSAKAQQIVDQQLETLDTIKDLLKSPVSPVKAVSDLQEENKKLQKQIEILQSKLSAFLKTELKAAVKQNDGFNSLVSLVNISDPKAVKDLAYQLEKEKTLAAHIKGGGGGQPFFATAGGSDASGLEKSLKSAEELIGS